MKFKIFYILITIVLLFLVLEIITRIISPAIGCKYYFTNFDGPHFIPNSVFILNTENYVKDEINSFGYHDREYKAYKQLNVKRIGFFGDSFVESLQVEKDSIFYNILEDSLNSKFYKIECLGFGASGFGVGQSYIRYLIETIRFNLDEIVYVFFFNDIKDNFKQLKGASNYPFIEFSDNKIKFDDSYKKDISKENRFNWLSDFKIIDSYFISFIRYRKGLLFQKIKVTNTKNNLFCEELSGLEDDFILFNNQVPDVWQNALLNFQYSLKLWKKQTDLWGQKLTVLYLPNKLEVSDSGRDLLEKNGLIYNKLSERIEEICEKYSIRFLSPIEYFYMQTNGEDRLYWAHLNYNGHKLMAKYLLEKY